MRYARTVVTIAALSVSSLSIAPTAMAVTSGVAPESAETTTSLSGDTGDQQTITRPGLTRELIEKYDPYVSTVGNSFQFSPTDQMREESPGEVAAVQNAVDSTNASIASGVTTGTTPEGETYTISTPAGEMYVDGSHGGFELKWYGFEIWLDDWASNQLSNLLEGGAGASVIAAQLTSWTGIGELSGDAIAGILVIGAVGVRECNWNGRGIGIHWAPFTGAWCWPR